MHKWLNEFSPNLLRHKAVYLGVTLNVILIFHCTFASTALAQTKAKASSKNKLFNKPTSESILNDPSIEDPFAEFGSVSDEELDITSESELDENLDLELDSISDSELESTLDTNLDANLNSDLDSSLEPILEPESDLSLDSELEVESDKILTDELSPTDPMTADALQLEETNNADSSPILSEQSFDEESLNEENLSEESILSDVKSLGGTNKPQDTKRIKFIRHPGQKQGLYKIAADGKYYYKVEESKQKYGLGLKGGAVVLNQLENVENGAKFNDLYGSSAKGAFFIEYYWAYFKNKNVSNFLKKARVKLGSGLLLATGNGQFNNPAYANVQSLESMTFLAFPNHLGLHLSFEFKHNQLVVPFVTGALEYLIGIETQNDNLSRTKLLGQLGAHFGGGLALSLGWLDEAAKFNLDSEFGINQTYLTAEFRQNIAIQSDFNFTATFLNVGLQLEF